MTDVVLGYSRKIVCGLEPGWFGHKRNTNEISQNLITVARSTGIRTVQQLVQVSNLHATGVDPLEPGSFLRDQCDGFSTHLLCPNISVRSGLVMSFFFFFSERRMYREYCRITSNVRSRTTAANASLLNAIWGSLTHWVKIFTASALNLKASQDFVPQFGVVPPY